MANYKCIEQIIIWVNHKISLFVAIGSEKNAFNPRKVVLTRPFLIQIFNGPWERWPSGLRRTLGKRV